MSGRDFIIISSVDWGFLWQGPQETATRLARKGIRVLFVENAGVRAPGIRDARRISARPRRWASARRLPGLRSAADDSHILEVAATTNQHRDAQNFRWAEVPDYVNMAWSLSVPPPLCGERFHSPGITSTGN